MASSIMFTIKKLATICLTKKYTFLYKNVRIINKIVLQLCPNTFQHPSTIKNIRY